MICATYTLPKSFDQFVHLNAANCKPDEVIATPQCCGTGATKLLWKTTVGIIHIPLSFPDTKLTENIIQHIFTAYFAGDLA